MPEPYHITSHHTQSHHITSHHITSHHISVDWGQTRGDDTLLLSGSWDGSIKLWDCVSAQASLSTFAAHTGYVYRCALHYTVHTRCCCLVVDDGNTNREASALKAGHI